MKALSIRQPWAWLIAHGYKDIENRTWSTKFRGKFLIHASKTIDHNGYALAHKMGISPPSESVIERGGIVGIAEIVDCTHASASPWAFGPYMFVLQNAQPIKFIPLRGRLGFFDVNFILPGESGEKNS